jgi:chitinase
MKIAFNKLLTLALLGLMSGLISCKSEGSLDPTPTNGGGGGGGSTPGSTEVMINGYLPDWKPSSFYSSVDYTHLTIAYFAFIVCDTNGNIITNGNESKMAVMISSAHAANTKAYLSFGGGGYFGSTDFFKMAKNDISRKEFAHQVKDFCLTQGFDGFDVDWEGLANANQGLAHEALLTTLKDTLHSVGLGLAVTVQQGYSADPFTLNGINQADLVQIMSYDETGTYSGSAKGQHSSYEFAESGISYWKGKGVVASKLVVGVPFYGYRFASMPCPCPSVTYASIVNKYPSLADETDYLSSGIYSDTYFNGFSTIADKVYLSHQQGTAGIMIWEMSQDATGSKSLLTKTVNYLTNLNLTVKKLSSSIP